MRKTYSEFCSRHTKALKLYKELCARDKRFQQFIRVSGPGAARRPGPNPACPFWGPRRAAAGSAGSRQPLWRVSAITPSSTRDNTCSLLGVVGPRPPPGAGRSPFPGTVT